jgi:nucleoside-diphosphate-sugar epimerase
MTIVAIAGVTGDLGERIAAALRTDGASVRALVRPGSDPKAQERLRSLGCTIAPVDMRNVADLTKALRGADVIVSALSGVRDVIVDLQGRLLEAAVAAGVPRFIPSDFAVDFRGHRPGSNRNLDLRREFMESLDAAPIRATSVLCGMFTDLLKGTAPMVITPIRRVVYWGNADQRLDFTTIGDTAAFTAQAALDPEAPRWLRIAGEATTARGVARSASAAWGRPFGLLRAGSLRTLLGFIGLVRRLSPAEREVFPAWQGMQYFHSMFEGGVAFDHLDNNRYGRRRWTSVEEMLREGAPAT